MKDDHEFCPCCLGVLNRLRLEGEGHGAMFCIECGWEEGDQVIDVASFFEDLDDSRQAPINNPK